MLLARDADALEEARTALGRVYLRAGSPHDERCLPHRARGTFPVVPSAGTSAAPTLCALRIAKRPSLRRRVVTSTYAAGGSGGAAKRGQRNIPRQAHQELCTATTLLNLSDEWCELSRRDGFIRYGVEYTWLVAVGGVYFQVVLPKDRCRKGKLYGFKGKFSDQNRVYLGRMRLP